MFLEQNLQALSTAHPVPPPWLDALLAKPATGEVELFATEAGDYTLQYRGITLHAAQGAETEARQTVQSACRPALDRVHLILGLGLGYVLEATFERSPGQIVIYEPDLALLRLSLENVDFTAYLGSGRVRLATNPSELLNVLHPILCGEDPLDIIAIPGFATLMAAEIPALMEPLFALVEERLRDYRTGKHFHELWSEQFFKNLPRFGQTIGFETIRAAFADKPALLIGRGPSLDTAIDDVQALAPGMTLIAVGGALHRLHQAGITPDFAVFYDANGMQEQLHGLPDSYLENITFLVSPFTQPCCFMAPAKAKVLFFPQHAEPFAHWLTQGTSAADAPLVVEGGGTVSLIALQTALAMRCNPVVLIGQDLAFPNNQAYAGGIPLALDEQGRMALQKSETLYAAPEATTMVTGQDGKPLRALKAYASFIRHFERIAQAFASGYKLINASLGGAHIEGYTLTPLHELQGVFPAWKNSETRPVAVKNETIASRDMLRQAIAHLRAHVGQAVMLHETALAQPGGAIDREIFEFLNQHPLISHFLMFEMMDTQRQYNPQPETADDIEHNRALLHRNTERCLSLLRERILPWIIQAEQQTLAKTAQSTSNPALGQAAH